jgi:hypothetical protein
MTILKEADLLTFEENHPAYIQGAVNPVLASAEFVLRVSHLSFNDSLIEILSEYRYRANQ